MYTPETEFLIPSDQLRSRYQDDDESSSEVETEYKTSTRPSKINRFIIFLSVILVLAFFYIPINLNIIKHRSASVIGWNQTTTREIRFYVSDKNTTLVEPFPVCDNKLLLLVVVCSAVKNFEARDVIRTTWKNENFNYHPYFKMFHPQSEFEGKYLPPEKQFITNEYLIPNSNESNLTNVDPTNLRFNVKVVFLLGKPEPSDYDAFSQVLQNRIYNESLQYGDIIQEDFIDSYNNLTLKSIFMLKWVRDNCLDKVKFLLKCDDDTFINIPNLLHVLLGGTVPIYNATVGFYDKLTVNNKLKRNRLQQNNLLTGFLFCSVRPVSDANSKYFSPAYMYSGDFYPNYLSGTGYLMSIDVVERLYRASLATPLFHLEDVFLTGIVADRIKLKRKGHPLFYYSTTKDKCAMRGMISQHQLGHISDYITMYEYITNTTIRCRGISKKYTTSKSKFINRRKCQ